MLPSVVRLSVRLDCLSVPCRRLKNGSLYALNKLQTVQLIACHANQRRIAVVKLCQHKGQHQRLYNTVCWETERRMLPICLSVAKHPVTVVETCVFNDALDSMHAEMLESLPTLVTAA